jgi:hypothetical protein
MCREETSRPLPHAQASGVASPESYYWDRADVPLLAAALMPSAGVAVSAGAGSTLTLNVPQPWE